MDSKTVVIAWDRRGPTVTVRPGPNQPPYRSAPLLHGGTKPIENLPARCRADHEGHRYLEIEAGTEELGPTYRLYATVDAEFGRDVGRDTPAAHITLVPAMSIGLYDDYDDDLGVPWALPLNPLRWAPELPARE
jgi:hypothetical protein